jgi:hypothetical protein
VYDPTGSIAHKHTPKLLWINNIGKKDKASKLQTFIHLGHPLVLPAKNRSEAYNFILQKFRNKLTTYKENSLSHAAKVELINLVLPPFLSITCQISSFKKHL